MSRPPLPRTPAGRKDGGIKLLDINEQPLGFAQAKKRKRMQGSQLFLYFGRFFHIFVNLYFEDIDFALI